MSAPNHPVLTIVRHWIECPYCGHEVSELVGCCSESSGHMENRYEDDREFIYTDEELRELEKTHEVIYECNKRFRI